MTLKRYTPGAILLMLVWTITISAANPIIIENALTGTRDWQISDEYAYARQIEGYADKVSINIGGTITFLVNLRDSTSYDPLYTPVSQGGSPENYLTTTLWRNMRTDPELGTQCPTSADCFKYPEDEIVGVMTNLANPTGRGHFTFVTLPPIWVTRNVPDPLTPFANLVGYEADEYHIASNNYPGRATTLKIADSEFVGDFISTRAHAVYYTMNSGARVFAVGTIEWGLGLDDFGTVNEPGPNLHADYHDTDAEAVTTNILVCLRDGGAACS